jgi:hypothetical protein
MDLTLLFPSLSPYSAFSSRIMLRLYSQFDAHVIPVPKLQGRLPPVRRPVLLRVRRCERQRTRVPRGDPPVRRDPRSVILLTAFVNTC